MGSVPQNRSATNGFHRKSAHQSGGGERGSSRKRSPPEIRAPSQPESAPRQRFAGNPHAKAAAEGVPLRRIAGERPSEQRIQRFEAGQARFAQRKGFAGEERAEPAGACPVAAFSSGSHALGAGETRAAGVDNSTLRRIGGGSVRVADSVLRSRSGAVCPAEELRRGRTCRASRSLSCGSVSPGKHASGAGKFRAAGVDDSTLRRIGGGAASEQRIQRFEAGQARFVQRNGSAGKERRASWSSSRGSVFVGKPRAGRWGDPRCGEDDSTLRRIGGGMSEQRIQCFEAGQARFVQRKSFAGKPRAGAAAEGVLLRRIAGERPSE